MSEIRELSVKELQERIDNEKNQLIRTKMNHAVSPMDNPTKIKYARRDIAKMITEMNQRMLSEKNQK